MNIRKWAEMVERSKNDHSLDLSCPVTGQCQRKKTQIEKKTIVKVLRPNSTYVWCYGPLK